MSSDEAQKKYFDEESDERLRIRTMKKDLERLRQGLSLEDTVLRSESVATPTAGPSRRIAPEVKSHAPEELPPPELARGRPQAAEIRPETAPIRPPRAAVSMTAVAPPEFRPIETMAATARPEVPQTPRAGRIEIGEASPEPKTQAETKTEAAFSRLTRLLSSGKRLAAALLGLAVLLAGGGYWLMARFGKPLPGTTFIFPSYTPLLSVSPATTQVSLPPIVSPTPSSGPARSAYLPVTRLALISLTPEATRAELLRRLGHLASIEDAPGDFKQVVVEREGSGAALTAREFFSLLGILPPQGVIENVSPNLTLFFYTHRDVTPGGEAQQGGTRFGILAPLTGDKAKLKEALAAWEATLGGDFAIFAFERPWKPPATPLFQTNIYQGAPIRYQNFPDPYLAVDYVIYEGTTPPLLIFTTSRESMFTVIQILNYRS